MVILPVLIAGVILGIYEFFSVYKLKSYTATDGGQYMQEKKHPLKYFLQAVIFMCIFLFLIMNASELLTLMNISYTILYINDQVLVAQVIVALVLFLKMNIAGAITQGKPFSKRFAHTLIISLIAITLPYIWPLIAPYLPIK